jgi:hypothetical protein
MDRIWPMASALRRGSLWSGGALACWCGSAHRGDQPTRCPAARMMRSAPWSPCSGHARVGGVARLARVRRQTRCIGKGSTSIVGVAATCLTRWRWRGLTRATAWRAGAERRRPDDVQRWRSRSGDGWHQWRGPAVLEEKGEGEAHANCEPRRTEDRLTEEVENRCWQ